MSRAVLVRWQLLRQCSSTMNSYSWKSGCSESDAKVVGYSRLRVEGARKLTRRNAFAKEYGEGSCNIFTLYFQGRYRTWCYLLRTAEKARHAHGKFSLFSPGSDRFGTGAVAQKDIPKITGSHSKHWTRTAAICWVRKPPRRSSYKRGSSVRGKTRQPLKMLPLISAPFAGNVCFPTRVRVLPRTEWLCWGVYTNSNIPCELLHVHRWASGQKKHLDIKQNFTKVLQVIRMLVDQVHTIALWFTCVRWLAFA